MRSALYPFLLLLCLSLVPSRAAAQAELYDPRLTVFGAPAYATVHTTTPYQAGFSLDATTKQISTRNVAVGFLLEGGYQQPARVGGGTAYFSADGMLSRFEPSSGSSSRQPLLPLVVAGYTRLHNTANAANFGAGVERGLGEGHFAVRAEVRDQWAIASGQHNVGFRLGFVMRSTFR